MFLKEIKEQCLFTEDNHGNKKHRMYEKIADEFNKETLSKTANLVALSKDVLKRLLVLKMSVMLINYFFCLRRYCVLLQI